jgi:putative membrane protein
MGEERARLRPPNNTLNERVVGWWRARLLLATAIPVAVFTPVLLYIAVAWAAVALPVAVILALDAYRSLGHGISGGYLVARSGTVRRATVALQRGGVIGWSVKQSYFQRRSGLITLRATTAAGAGAYEVYDAQESEGLTFAADAVPGVLEPFLDRGEWPPPR